MLADLTIKKFLAETAGNKPAPGSGSVSALCGAIATALTEMVANLTIGMEQYADVEGQMKTIAVEAATIRERLIEYIDKDSEVHNQDAKRHAVLIQMTIAEEIGSVMETVIYVAHKGKRDAITEASIAMMTARTCVLGALLNVRINLSSIKDEDLVKRMTQKADHLEAEAIRIENKLLSWVKTKL